MTENMLAELLASLGGALLAYIGYMNRVKSRQLDLEIKRLDARHDTFDESMELLKSLRGLLTETQQSTESARNREQECREELVKVQRKLAYIESRISEFPCQQDSD